MKQALCNESLFATAGMENVLVRLAQLLVDTEHRYRAAVFRWETLKSLQGHSLTPLSLTLSHTHTQQTQVILKGHPAFPTFPMVPGILASISKELPDPHTHTIVH